MAEEHSQDRLDVEAEYTKRMKRFAEDRIKMQVAEYEKSKHILQEYGEAHLAAALSGTVIAKMEGEAIEEVLQIQMKAARNEAIVNTTIALAKAAGATGYAWLTGSPSAWSSAAQYTMEAGLWAGVVGLTAGASALMGSPSSGSGGSGGKSDSGDDGTGSSSTLPKDNSSTEGSGPITIVVNVDGLLYGSKDALGDAVFRASNAAINRVDRPNYRRR